ncbi:MAG: YraN family protein [Ottowia sp.]|nr:YraN family protein [Ottowia sp.]
MIFNWKKPGKSPAAPPATTRTRGAAAENAALEYLQAAGLALVERNVKTPGRGGGEIDLIMRDAGGVLIFVEVRARRSAAAGGAAASVTTTKQRRIILAAQHYLLRHRNPPPCRFDVVASEGGNIEWIQGAFGTQ